MSTLSNIKGVIPAMLTPFAPDESIDEARVRALTKHLCAQGIGGLYLTGSTGEGFMMTPDERKRVVEAVMAEATVPVIVHVGAISSLHTKELARHAASVGAAAVSSVPPIYWHFSDDSICGYYNDIAQSSGLPVVVYNIALAGLVSFDMVKRLGHIDGVEGIKYTASTHYDIFRIKEALGDDFKVYSGSDEMAMSGLAFGADGLIGSTYNVLSPLFVQLDAAMKANDVAKAQELQQLANRFIFTFLNYDLNPALKLALSWEGVDAGISRAPFTRFTPAQEQSMRDAFTALKAEVGDAGLAFMKAL